MGSALPYQSSCCNSCTDPQVQNVPGAKGDPGADGSAGTDGIDAYTTTSANFTMPAHSGVVTVTVGDTSWMAIGQVLYVENAGWMRVDGITDINTVDLLNLEDGAGNYDENVVPTTVVPAGSVVSPGGLQGPGNSLVGAAGGDLEGTYPDPTLEITTALGDLIYNNNAGVAPRNTRLPLGTANQTLHADTGAPAHPEWRTFDMTGVNSAIAGALPIANGGTGQATQTNAFDALAPTTAKGDLIVRNAADNVRQAVGANDTVLVADSTQANGVRWSKLGPENLDADAEEATTETIILRDVKASNTDGDASVTPTTWHVRDITEISTDTTGAVVLSAEGTGHKFSLPEGYYRIHAVAVGYQIGYHMILLWDVTAGSVVPHADGVANITGTTCKSPAGSDQPTTSELHGRFFATSGHTFCIKHYAELPAVAAGFGKAANITAIQECYMTIMLEKIAKT